ncbi:MAG: aldo/keto reductase [Oscillospiraceae bacterium]|jgi:predicted aldo/keto reductase-like oxidoreductase|nr:aldo/keto reductase [Oscillospiraceae bacterium]
MQYRNDKYGNKLSGLGFGCMRFPRGLNGKFDYGKSEELILTAVENGVNYFDTAYLYAGSEETLGEALRRHDLRDKVNIATKLPFLRCGRYADFDRLFDEQLARLKTDRVDYYLIHNLPTPELWRKLTDIGVEKWIAEKKASGAIGQIGFSFHGTQDDFLKLLDAYPWEFCQIQYNYMNENYQAGKAGLQAAAAKGLPVVIMEPLLGGRLANGVPKKGVEIFSRENPAHTPAAWALRWLWNQPEVTVILSGMNADRPLRDNLKTAETATAGCLTEQEAAATEAVKAIFEAAYKIPCTGCNYCMPCPKGVNIPAIFAAYNARFANGFVTGIMQYVTSTGVNTPEKNYTVRRCVKCGACEKHCPQHIAVTRELVTATKKMEPFWFKAVIKILHNMQRSGKRDRNR